MSTKTTPKPAIPGGRPLQPVPEPEPAAEPTGNPEPEPAAEASTAAPEAAASGNDDAGEPVEPPVGKTDDADRFAIVWLRFGSDTAFYRETTLHTSDDPVDIIRLLASIDPGGGQLDVRDLDPTPYRLVTIDEIEAIATLAATPADTATVAETIEAARSSLERNRQPTDLFATTTIENLTNRVADIIDPDGDLFDGERLDDGETTGNAATGTTTLFTVDDYNDPALAIPKIDGNSIDRIAIAFSGEIFLDRTEKTDVALYNRLHMGDDVELRISAKVLGTGAKGATNRDGDLDVIVGKKSLKVDTVYVLTPEEL